MTCDGQLKLICGDSLPVILDNDATDAAFIEFDLDLLRARIEGVFKKLFDNRGGAFNDFACSNLTDKLIREELDVAHGLLRVVCVLWNGFYGFLEGYMAQNVANIKQIFALLRPQIP